MSESPMFKAWDIRRKKVRIVRDIKFFSDGVRVNVADHEGNYEPLLNMIGHDPEFILLRCVGLKDKSGNMSYEGDLVRNGERFYRIDWCEKFARYGAKTIKTESVLCKGMTFPLWQYLDEDTGKLKFEIVGCSYEFPNSVVV